MWTYLGWWSIIQHEQSRDDECRLVKVNSGFRIVELLDERIVEQLHWSAAVVHAGRGPPNSDVPRLRAPARGRSVFGSRSPVVSNGILVVSPCK